MTDTLNHDVLIGNGPLVGKIVRYTDPDDYRDAPLRFVVLEDCGDGLLVQQIASGLAIAPTFCHPAACYTVCESKPLETLRADSGLIIALRLMNSCTKGYRYSFDSLVGPQNALYRAHIMTELLDVKTPIAKSGISALRAAIFSRCGISGDCIAVSEYTLAAIAKHLI